MAADLRAAKANALLAKLIDGSSDPEERAKGGLTLAALLAKPALAREVSPKDALASSPTLLAALADALDTRAPGLLPVADAAAAVACRLVEADGAADRPAAYARRAWLAVAGLAPALAAHVGDGPENVGSLRTTACRGLALLCAAPVARALIAGQPAVLYAITIELLQARGGAGPASAHGVRAAFELSLDLSAAVRMAADRALVSALVALVASAPAGPALRMRAALALANVTCGRESASLDPLVRAAMRSGALAQLPALLAEAVETAAAGRGERTRWEAADLLHTTQLLVASADGWELILCGLLADGGAPSPRGSPPRSGFAGGLPRQPPTSGVRRGRVGTSGGGTDGGRGARLQLAKLLWALGTALGSQGPAVAAAAAVTLLSLSFDAGARACIRAEPRLMAAVRKAALKCDEAEALDFALHVLSDEALRSVADESRARSPEAALDEINSGISGGGGPVAKDLAGAWGSSVASSKNDGKDPARAWDAGSSEQLPDTSFPPFFEQAREAVAKTLGRGLLASGSVGGEARRGEGHQREEGVPMVYLCFAQPDSEIGARVERALGRAGMRVLSRRDGAGLRSPGSFLKTSSIFEKSADGPRGGRAPSRVFKKGGSLGTSTFTVPPRPEETRSAREPPRLLERLLDGIDRAGVALLLVSSAAKACPLCRLECACLAAFGVPLYTTVTEPTYSSEGWLRAFERRLRTMAAVPLVPAEEQGAEEFIHNAREEALSAVAAALAGRLLLGRRGEPKQLKLTSPTPSGRNLKPSYPPHRLPTGLNSSALFLKSAATGAQPPRGPTAEPASQGSAEQRRELSLPRRAALRAEQAAAESARRSRVQLDAATAQFEAAVAELESEQPRGSPEQPHQPSLLRRAALRAEQAAAGDFSDMLAGVSSDDSDDYD